MPGEPCHQWIQSSLTSPPTPDCVRGTLFVRDGLPLVVLDPLHDSIEGSVHYFKPESQQQTYEQIATFEPRTLYRWQRTFTSNHGIEVNILVARSLDKGHPEPFEGNRWSHRYDPVFGEGLRVVAENVHEFGRESFQSAPPERFDWPRFFRLQMTYLLLWAAIERYTTLAFGPDLSPMDRVKRLGASELFQTEVRAHVKRTSVVTDSRNLDPYRLDPASPADAALYYYQIRNNLSHRGKGTWNDAELVRKALQELLEIFKGILGV